MFYANTVTQEKLNELYAKWGGIVRYVLQKATNDTDQNELEVAIKKCTTRDIMTYTGAEAAPEHISHKLLHMIVERYPPTKPIEQRKAVDRYSTYFIDAATEYVAQKLAGVCLPIELPFFCMHYALNYFTDRFGGEITHHLGVLRSLQAQGGTGILFGHLYKHFAYQVIPRGGDFHPQPWNKWGIYAIHWAKDYKETVDDLPSIATHEYGQGHETFPAIDAVVRIPPALFNMTVSRTKQRGLNDSSLSNVFTHLPLDKFPRRCHYYWVILPDRFDNFEKQSISGMSREDRDGLMLQFALELAITEPPPQQNPSKRKGDVEERDEAAKAVRV